MGIFDSFFGSSPSSTATSTQTSAPWSVQQPYLADAFSRARGLYQQGGQQFYPGNTVAGFSPEQNQGMGMMAARAKEGSPLIRTAKDTLGKTLSGGFLGANPELDRMYEAASRPVVQQFQRAVEPGISSRMEAAGRFGSGAHGSLMSGAREDLGRSLGDLSARLYGGAYESERDRMGQAMLFAPQMAASDYADIEQLMKVGQMQQGQEQQQIDAERERFDYGQNRQLEDLKNYLALISGNLGSTTTTQTPIYRNRAAGGLGGALAGASIADMMKFSPGAGAGIGALLGIL